MARGGVSSGVTRRGAISLDRLFDSSAVRLVAAAVGRAFDDARDCCGDSARYAGAAFVRAVQATPSRPIARPLRKIVTGPLSLITAIVVDGWS
jgi:hypothetical protein